MYVYLFIYIHVYIWTHCSHAQTHCSCLHTPTILLSFARANTLQVKAQTVWATLKVSTTGIIIIMQSLQSPKQSHRPEDHCPGPPAPVSQAGSRILSYMMSVAL